MFVRSLSCASCKLKQSNMKYGSPPASEAKNAHTKKRKKEQKWKKEMLNTGQGLRGTRPVFFCPILNRHLECLSTFKSI